MIHAVGPVYGGRAKDADVLASTYRACMRIALERGFASIAFPSISTGAYRYPVDQAPIALNAVLDSLHDATKKPAVRFVLFDGETLAAYRKALTRL